MIKIQFKQLFNELENTIIENQNIDLNTVLIFLDLLDHNVSEYYTSAKEKLKKIRKMVLAIQKGE